MSELDLTSAVEAVLSTSPIVWAWTDGRLEPYRPGEARKVAERQITAALPHILEALIAKAEAEKDELLKAHPEPEFRRIFWGVAGDGLDLCRQALTVEWLRAELAEQATP